MNPNQTTNSPTVASYVYIALLLPVLALLCLVTYNHLGEDAFISYRYARNFANGWGLVYNRAEYVEGYSNLAWVLMIAPFELLGVKLHTAGRAISSLSFILLVFTAWYCTETSKTEKRARWLNWWLPLALALEPFLHYHDDRGLETVLYASLISSALLLYTLKGLRVLPGILLAIVTITRPEGLLFLIALSPCWIARIKRSNEIIVEMKQVVEFLIVFLPAMLTFLVQVCFRFYYYGELVPNTMIAKTPSGGGMHSIVAFVLTNGALPLFGLLGAFLALRIDTYRPLAAGVIGIYIASFFFQLQAGQLLNIAFRYIAPLFPAVVIGCWLLLVAIARYLEAEYSHQPQSKVLMLPGLFLLLLVPVQIRSTSVLPQYLVGNMDAPESRILPRLFQKHTWDIVERIKWYNSDPIYLNAEAGRWVSEKLPKDTLIAGDQLGQWAFYTDPDQRIMDLLGLMDSHIAHNGLSVEYILERSPDYLVVETCLDDTYWPKSYRLQPNVASVRRVFQLKEIQDNYTPTTLLTSFHPALGFMVYERRKSGESQEITEIKIGVSDEEWRKTWGLKPATDQ